MNDFPLLPLAPVPDLANLIGLAQIWFAVAVMTLAGRLVLWGREGLGIQMLAGWGVLCLWLTPLGVLTALPLGLAAAAFAVLALGGLLPGGTAGWRRDLSGDWRVLAVGLPLLILTADMQPSQIDVFAVMIPNSAYLVDHGTFPTALSAPAFSDVPVAPYAKELAVFLGNLVGGGFIAGTPSLFAVAIHLAAALLLARLLTPEDRNIGWGAAGLGWLLATLLDPGFAPRVAFSGMGEPHLAVTAMIAAWMGSRLAARTGEAPFLALALILAAMVTVKQQGIGLLVSLLFGMLVCAAADSGGRPAWRILGRLALAALPALLLYALWRGHVTLQFPKGELRPLPMNEWALGKLPEILWDMGAVILHKPYHFSCLAAVIGLALRPPAWLSPATRRLAVVVAGTTFPYTAVLLFSYVVLYREEHSFFRYSAHLSLMVGLALILTLRDLIASWPEKRRERLLLWSPAPAIIMAVAPLAGLHLLRFDLDQPQPQLRAAARALAASVRNDDRISILLPGDNATSALAFEAMLRFGQPRRLGLNVAFSPRGDASAYDASLADHRPLLFLSCTDGNPLGLPEGAAALLRHENGRWVTAGLWLYPPPPPRKWWNSAGYLASEPFCIRNSHPSKPRT